MAAEPLTSPKIVGKARPRVDGPLKVTGRAMYSSDHHFPGMLYAVPVSATIANGKIEKIDTAAAEKMPGVRAIYHQGNIGKLFRVSVSFGDLSMIDETRPPFEDDVIRYYGQYVALAVADTFERAGAAADAVKVTYRREEPNVERELGVERLAGVRKKGGAKPEQLESPKVQSERGEPEPAYEKAAMTLDATYLLPAETHNPIELHATVAVWDGSGFTLYDTTQAVVNARNVLAQMLGVPKENMRVISKFLGSGFGGKLWPWTHCALAAAAARQLNLPVKLVINRRSMFQCVGHRPLIQQRVRLSATQEGRLTSLRHEYVNHTSMLDDYEESCGEGTPHMYSVPNLRVTSALARRNVGTPTSMRGPGAVPGLYATESAMNELADLLKMDPVQLRLANEPEIDEGTKLPFSSRHLRECLTTGAEKFGWAQRTPAIGSMKRDGLTVGWGMASCTWIAKRFGCTARVELRDDGTAAVSTATQDIGTGTYTVLAQITAEKLQIPVEKIEVILGDSSLPEGPVSGGSMATASVIPAVMAAAGKAAASLLGVAAKAPGSPFAGSKPDGLTFQDGKVQAKGGGEGVPFGEILKKAKMRGVSGQGSSDGNFLDPKPQFSSHSFGAHFVEVTWQPETVRLRINRVLTVIDAGRIVNPLAGRNQIEGAVVMGVGMTLFEQTQYEHGTGAPINSNLADYIMAVNADVPKLDVIFLDYPDLHLNEFGARGIGEIGLAGIAAAITSAIHHATGFRARKLPVTIEDLLGAPTQVG
ncbi:xanthine dehydrogenase family protein molybdopterin-binding subunit [Verrucomicrobium sp. BvORR034]|uniref:xanthine dehydrogenase family protein molybdopterin-binding subunit n=1 Tax=Verrucomicrobium sp. BvORR034 TaxID=1396418 RepID=UPI0006788465|nr:xanthine dehydrogenase family protein molybdopterin-binding subunit [Verrucomicrobium sp. BvORR034]